MVYSSSYSASGSASYTLKLRLECSFIVLNCLLINREDTVLAACLDRHVADRETVIHGKVLDALADKLHGLVQRAIYADHTDDM